MSPIFRRHGAKLPILLVGLAVAGACDDDSSNGSAGGAGGDGSESGGADAGGSGGTNTGGSTSGGGTGAGSNLGGMGGDCTGSTIACDALAIVEAAQSMGGAGSHLSSGFSFNPETLAVSLDLVDGAPAIASATVRVNFGDCDYYCRCNAGSSYSSGDTFATVDLEVHGNQLTGDLSSLAGIDDAFIERLDFQLTTECGDELTVSMMAQADGAPSACENDTVSATLFCEGQPGAGDGDDPQPEVSGTFEGVSCGAAVDVSAGTEQAPIAVTCADIIDPISFDNTENVITVAFGDLMPSVNEASMQVFLCEQGAHRQCVPGLYDTFTIPLFENGDVFQGTLDSVDTNRLHAYTISFETDCGTYLVAGASIWDSVYVGYTACYGYE